MVTAKGLPGSVTDRASIKWIGPSRSRSPGKRISAGRPARFIWAAPSRRSRPRSAMSSAGKVSSSPYIVLAQQSLFDSSRAPAGKHTAWAYCHVPHGSTADVSALIESRIERYAPGFREVILAKSVLSAAAMEQYNANYVGGDINGGLQDLSSALYPAHCFSESLPDIGKKYLSLLFLHPPRRRRSRSLRLLCGTIRL